LASLGVEVDVATTDDDGPGVRAVPLGAPIPEHGALFRYFARRTQFYTVSPGLARWVEGSVDQYDLVHIHALFSYPPIVAARAAQRSRVPYLIRPLGTLNRYGMQRRAWLKRLSLRMVERSLIESASALHFTSVREKQEAEQLGIRFRSVVIPNIVETADDEERQPDPYKILFLSRLDPVKGLDLLLAAFARVRQREPRARLHIAGDGEASFVTSLKNLADQLGVGAAVEWTGFAEGETKRSAFSRAGVFVLPSRSENFGIAVAEAMSHGVPVVVSRNVAITGDINAASAGCVVEPEVATLAEAINGLLRDEEGCRRMGERGRELVRKQYSPEAVAGQLIGLYREVCRR
jgi:glycosyltransferase involved in cell wall biosynthesis